MKQVKGHFSQILALVFLPERTESSVMRDLVVTIVEGERERLVDVVDVVKNGIKLPLVEFCFRR